MRRAFTGLLLLWVIVLQGQAKYPADAFGSPLDVPIILAGTFGELRSNHFHSGLDIKTQQREGLPIYSIADGSVTRIKISHWGYGKVMYVAHPNGFTSVYGHLQKFSPAIEAYIKKMQYEKRSYEIELLPDFGDIKVAKGSVIGYTGNTGGSSGPHLHFEIRNSVSEWPTNPLLYGFDVRDATNPVLSELYAYPLSDDAVINKSNGKVQLTFKKRPDGTFLADKVYAAGTIGLGINTYDRQDLAANQNGVYSIVQQVNGSVYSAIDFEDFSFTETRYINTLIDYDHLNKYRQRIVKCFRSPGNSLSIYSEVKNDGKITVEEGFSYNAEIQIADFKGNTTILTVPIEGRREIPVVLEEQKKTPEYVIAKKANNYDLGIAQVNFPADTFYENFYIDLQNGTDTVTIHNNSIATHRNFTITFDVSKYAESERKYLFIARLDDRLRPNYESTYKRAERFTTRTRNLGTYTLVKDTTPPVLKAKNFKQKQWLNNYRYLSVHLSDDLSGVETYSATLNGEWILMEYEPKSNTLTYNFDDIILDKKECELRIVATDNVGNATNYSIQFFRK